MFDPPFDVDEEVWSQRRKHSHSSEEIGHGITTPTRETLPFQHSFDEVVTETVKSLGIICKQDKVFFNLENRVVKVFVEIKKMICHPSPREKHLLILADKLLGGVNHRKEKYTSHKAIPGVVDGNWSGVSNFQGNTVQWRMRAYNG